MAMHTGHEPPLAGGRKIELQDRFWAIRETLALIKEGVRVGVAVLGLLLFAAIVVFAISGMIGGHGPLALEIVAKSPLKP
jgi:hypothetical protein